jgi:hypothetical protein
MHTAKKRWYKAYKNSTATPLFDLSTVAADLRPPAKRKLGQLHVINAHALA